MNKSPEFDMLKEPAEPENTKRQRGRKEGSQRGRQRRGKREEEVPRKRRGTEKGVQMIVHEQKRVSIIKRVS